MHVLRMGSLDIQTHISVSCLETYILLTVAYVNCLCVLATQQITSYNKKKKSAKLAQNTPVVFVVNSMVMTTFLGSGYLTWRADTANSVFGPFKSHYLGVPVEFGWL